MSESRSEIKAVQNALGPDPKCDPYPKLEFRDGSALFERRFAEEFYAHHPELRGASYASLKRTHHKDPIIQRVMKEFSDENVKFMDAVTKWRETWPEEAAKVDEARRKASAQRRERKRRQGSVSGTKRSRCELPWLTQDFAETKLAFLKKCRATALDLLTACTDLQDAFEEHRAFIQDMERDREDVF